MKSTDRLKAKPIFSPRNCTACWKCVKNCPVGAIGKVSFLWHRHAKPHKSICVGCMKCVEVCPHGCFSRP